MEEFLRLESEPVSLDSLERVEYCFGKTGAALEELKVYFDKVEVYFVEEMERFGRADSIGDYLV